jgi:hypothetical protein
MVKQATQRFHRQLERFDEAIHQKFLIYLQATNISRGVEGLHS